MKLNSDPRHHVANQAIPWWKFQNAPTVIPNKRIRKVEFDKRFTAHRQAVFIQNEMLTEDRNNSILFEKRNLKRYLPLSFAQADFIQDIAHIFTKYIFEKIIFKLYSSLLFHL